jgi:hypothetical protein
MPHAASVIGGVRVLPHESIVDRLVALENLVVHLALIVVPDLATGLREHGLDRQQVSHLMRLEDAPLRIDEGNAFVLEHETGLQLDRGQMIVHLTKLSNVRQSSQTHERVTIDITHGELNRHILRAY